MMSSDIEISNNSCIKQIIKIQYSLIESLYKKYAIYRIMIYISVLNRNIKLVNKYQEKNILTEYYILKYNKWIHEKNKLDDCLKILLYINNLINQLVYINNNLKSIENIHKKIMGATNTITLITNNKILSDALSKIDIIIQTLLKTPNIADLTLISHINHTKHNLCAVFDQIISIFDPHILCEYHINLDDILYDHIEPLGIFHIIYLSYGSYMVPTISLDNDELMNVTLLSQEKIFNYLEKNLFGKNKNIIIIKNYNNDINIRIRYDIANNIKDYEIKIIGLPHNVYVDMNKKIEYNIIPIKSFSLKKKKWQNTKKCTLKVIEKKNYKNLDSDLKTKYSHYDTNKNIFVVDYLFDKLLKLDKRNEIINKTMYDSFVNLAVNTSSIA